MMSELSDFRWRILFILSGESKSGTEVKRELEKYYEDEVNHGRLYPNLDDLVESGLIEKGKYDDRTNRYSLTDKGKEKVREQLEWILRSFVTDERKKKEIEDLLTSIADDGILQR